MKIMIGFCMCLYSLAFSQTSGKVEPVNDQLHQFMNVRDLCISDDNSELYFTVQSPFQEVSQIAFMKNVNGKWSAPELMEFSGHYSDMEPFLSPGQNRLYFASNRRIQDSANAVKDYDIWYIERKDRMAAWSKPVNMGQPVNSANDEFYPSLSANNNLYVTSESPQGMGKDDIWFCKWEGTAYAKPVLLSEAVNSKGYEFNAFISRNETFLLYTKYNSEGGLGSGDLYIAKKDKSGNWQKAENLGPEVNTKFMEYCPFYDEKNGILYFTSKRNTLQSQKFKNISELQKVLSESENGLSKLYKVKYKVKL